jgi:hypothetical protein
MMVVVLSTLASRRLLVGLLLVAPTKLYTELAFSCINQPCFDLFDNGKSGSEECLVNVLLALR